MFNQGRTQSVLLVVGLKYLSVHLQNKYMQDKNYFYTTKKYWVLC